MTAVGDRIELVSMPDDPDPIAPGTRGTVDWVGKPVNLGGRTFDQIGVKWDNGRTLGLTVPPDRFRIITDEVAPLRCVCGDVVNEVDGVLMHVDFGHDHAPTPAE